MNRAILALLLLLGSPATAFSQVNKPPCPAPEPAAGPGEEPTCSMTCLATRSTQLNNGNGTPAEIQELFAHVDITASFVLGPNTKCDGTAKELSTGDCETCSECWAESTASWTQHTTHNIGWEWRPVLPGGAGGWSTTTVFTRAGFLRANCGEFDSFVIEVAIVGTAQRIIYTEGITLTCGGC